VPTAVSPTAAAAAMVDPEPIEGSARTPRPGGRAAWTAGRRKDCGFTLGWAAIRVSRRGVRLLATTSAQGPGLELAEAVADAHAGQHGLAEDAPGLEAASRQRADAGVVALGVLGPVAAADGAHEADQLAAELQAAGGQAP
jgi:hypothetical protein